MNNLLKELSNTIRFISIDAIEKVNLEYIKKFENQSKFTQKVDELNQETDSLIEEIDKWQT